MARKIFFTALFGLPLCIGLLATRWPFMWWTLVCVAPFLLVGLHDVLQKQHSLLRVYPLVGHGRYLLESFRPEIQQYFVETNLDGAPFGREARSLIYARAKHQTDTVPFGTQHLVGEEGYEWMSHSFKPAPMPAEEPRVMIGGPDCSKPYASSHLNISAMSFGSLSKPAILALNHGARKGNFAHNTGEGGLSPYHLEPGGDLIWQIGTGYFGCRTSDGNFDPVQFRDKVSTEQVKMVEIKLSQGAKPGHGGILPGAKVTPEIARIRGVEVGKDVISPPAHTRFDDPKGLLEFVQELRTLSGGKPVGFKLCVGHRTEFLSICKAMVETGITPDYIAVDGAEGGTGAAPLELSNSVGMPLRDGLLFVNNALCGVGLRDRMRIVAAGKHVSGFDILRTLALGADVIYAARSMMFALGCIQARRCHNNECPVGVATQDPARHVGLEVQDKAERVYRYHKATVHSFLELLCCSGLSSSADLNPTHILRRVDRDTVLPLSAIYTFLEPGSLLDPGNPLPGDWRQIWRSASADAFRS